MDAVAQPICEPRRLFGRPRLDVWHPLAYKPGPYLPREGVEWWPSSSADRLHFVESDDRAVQYVRHFLALENTPAAWYHLIVRAVVLDAFFLALQSYVDLRSPNAFLLEYSCWCDGGTDARDPLYRHHRHMIVAARCGAQFVRHCWNKIREPPGVPCKVLRKIKSWQHLCNTLFSVSSRRATCNIVPPSKQSSPELVHYYVFKPVTVRFKLCVALSVLDGINDFVSNRKRNCPVSSYAHHCFLETPSLYAVAVRHVMEKAWSQLVVPVRKDFVPTGIVSRAPSEACLVLPDGWYMHFERNEAAARLEDAAWARMQSDKGNRFLEAVQDALWFPPPTLQRVLREVTLEWEEGEAAALRRQMAEQRTFFVNLLRQTESRHRSWMERQRAFYQVRSRTRETYLEKMIDWSNEREDEMETQRDYYRGRCEATQATLRDPSTSQEAKLQGLQETASQEKEEAERRRRERAESECYRTRVRWEECRRRWEEGLEHLHGPLRQYRQQSNRL